MNRTINFMGVRNIAFAFTLLLTLLALEADTREALIVTPIWFVILGIAYQSVRKNKALVAQPNES